MYFYTHIPLYFKHCQLREVCTDETRFGYAFKAEWGNVLFWSDFTLRDDRSQVQGTAQRGIFRKS